MSRAYVSIGSNIDRDTHIRAGVAALRERFRDLRLSRVYETKAVGFDGDDFYNLVVSFDSERDVWQVAYALRAIELAAGRDRRTERFAARTLDLDLLLYDDLVIDEDGIRLPREEILEYDFVLGPLAEIAPDVRHPVLGTTFGALWEEFDRTEGTLVPVSLRW